MSLASIWAPIGRRFLGTNNLTSRLGTAAGFVAAGIGANAVIDHQAEQKRAYYGEAGYDKRYGSAAEVVKGGVTLSSMWYGGWSLLGRDPITRVKNSIKYHSAQARRTNWSDLWEFPLSLPRTKASKFSNSDISRLRNVPRFGLRQAMGYAALASGGMTVPSEVPVIGLAAAGALGVAGLGYASIKSRGIRGALGHIGTGAAVIGAGGTIGGIAGNRNNNPTAEGTIIDMSTYNQSAVSRMNFSTAGLVQALHNSNRKF